MSVYEDRYEMIQTASTTPGIEDFCKTNGIPFQKNVPLSTLSTWKIGGPADFLVEPASETQIREILVFCKAEKIPNIVIGRGSNLLFHDAGLRGVVIRLDTHFSKVSVSENVIVAQSGVYIPRLARIALRHGLAGLEHMVGIPGNLGGLLTMNGGSFGQNIGDCVKRVRGITMDGEVKVFDHDDCHFDYRTSIFQSLKIVITDVELKLEKKCHELIRQDMLSVLRSRKDKFPRKEPNCGSVFKNDPGLYEKAGPPGKVIEELGLKGYRIGNAEVSRKHANFITNNGGATSKDVLSLIEKIRSRILKRYDVNLVCEVISVDTEGKLTPAGSK